MTEKPVRRYELCAERLETLEDVKKILNGLQIRIDTDNPLYGELKYYFSTEVVPRGYLEVFKEVGHIEIEKMTYEEIEKKALELSNEKTN